MRILDLIGTWRTTQENSATTILYVALVLAKELDALYVVPGAFDWWIFGLSSFEERVKEASSSEVP